MTKVILLKFSNLKSFDDAIKELKVNKTVFSDAAVKRLSALTKRLEEKISVPLLQELRQYPPVRDRTKKVRWKSDKQRRYVMMMATRGLIRLPYVRTNKLADSWRTSVTLTFTRQERKALLQFEVTNTTKFYQWVVGSIGQGRSASSMRLYRKPQQPFHSDSGWPLAYKIIQRYFDEAKEMVKVELKDWSISVQ